MEDPLRNKFENSHVDWNEPPAGHLDRFENRLNSLSPSVGKNKKSYRFLLAVASVLLLFAFFSRQYLNTEGMELKELSYEMSETQDYFSMIITERTEALHAYNDPEEKAIIKGVLQELNSLEKAYKELKVELKNSAGDTRIIHAMIRNFQNRITLLETVLLNLEQKQELKLKDHEKLHV